MPNQKKSSLLCTIRRGTCKSLPSFFWIPWRLHVASARKLPSTKLAPEMITMTDSLASHVISHSCDIKNTTDVKDARILGWLCETIAKVPKLGRRPNDTQIIKSNRQDTDRLDSFPEKPKDRTNWTCPYYCTKWKNTWEKKKIHHFACHISKWFQFSCVFKGASPWSDE